MLLKRSSEFLSQYFARTDDQHLIDTFKHLYNMMCRLLTFRNLNLEQNCSSIFLRKYLLWMFWWTCFNFWSFIWEKYRSSMYLKRYLFLSIDCGCAMRRSSGLEHFFVKVINRHSMKYFFSWFDQGICYELILTV